MEPKDPAKQVFTANLMPSRGSWLELEIDKKGIVYARIDRKRKLPITTLLRALPARIRPPVQARHDLNEEILKLFGNTQYIATHSRRTHQARGRGADRGVQEAAPRRAADARQRADLLRALFFDPKRYDLTKVGRYKLNRGRRRRPEDRRVLTTRTSSRSSAGSSTMPAKLGVPEDSKDSPRRDRAPPEPIRGELDESRTSATGASVPSAS